VRRTMNWKGFLMILAVMVIVSGTLLLILNNQLRSREEEAAGRRAALSRLEEENRDLKAHLELIGTEDYIVSSAMTNYAYMNKNDLRFEFTNPEALYAYTEEEMRIMLDEMAD